MKYLIALVLLLGGCQSITQVAIPPPFHLKVKGHAMEPDYKDGDVVGVAKILDFDHLVGGLDVAFFSDPAHPNQSIHIARLIAKRSDWGWETGGTNNVPPNAYLMLKSNYIGNIAKEP